MQAKNLSMHRFRLNMVLEWTKKLKIPELSCPEVLALSTTRLDLNFLAMGSTRPDLTRISKIWAQPDPKKNRNSGQNGRVDPIFGSELSTLVQTRPLRNILTDSMKVGREPYQSCYGLDPLRSFT